MRAKRSVSSAEGMRAGAVAVRTTQAHGGGVGFEILWRVIWAWLARRSEVQRQRRRLAALTPWELKDIGLTPEQARQESGKPFWRA